MNTSPSGSVLQKILTVIAVIFGLVLLVGGIYLAVLVVGYVAIGIIGQVLVFLGLLDGLFHFRRFHKVGEGHGENK